MSWGMLAVSAGFLIATRDAKSILLHTAGPCVFRAPADDFCDVFASRPRCFSLTLSDVLSIPEVQFLLRHH